jgi:hypothetical protein
LAVARGLEEPTEVRLRKEWFERRRRAPAVVLSEIFDFR